MLYQNKIAYASRYFRKIIQGSYLPHSVDSQYISLQYKALLYQAPRLRR